MTWINNYAELRFYEELAGIIMGAIIVIALLVMIFKDWKEKHQALKIMKGKSHKKKVHIKHSQRDEYHD